MSLIRRGLGATLALATVMLLLAPVTIGLGTCPAPPGALSTVELLCDSGAITKCPDLPLVTYPHKNTTKCVAPAVAQGDAGTGACMLPLAAQTSMPKPCDGAPSNPWCPADAAGGPLRTCPRRALGAA